MGVRRAVTSLATRAASGLAAFGAPLTRRFVEAHLFLFKALRHIVPGLRWRYPTRARARVLASGLFDEQTYLLACPDARRAPMDVVDHFLAFGWAIGCDPNPLFSVSWYLSTNPDVRRAGLNPLMHYIDAGEREGRQPSPAFSPRYYAGRYADVRDAAVGLLAHYLAQGRAERRAPLPASVNAAGKAVDLAAIVPLKMLDDVRDQDVALLVTHSPDGRLRPHATVYSQMLRTLGRKVVLIVMADAPFEAAHRTLDLCDALYVRENRGFDFAAWAHLLRVAPSLFAARTLILTNDSVLPPRTGTRLAISLQAMSERREAVLGLTDSYEAQWHIQSYFLLFKPPALASVAFLRFIMRIRSLDTKEEVIEAYELTFAAALREAGVACGVLYPARREINSTTAGWRDLICAGHPLVKLSTLQQRDASVCVDGWPQTLDDAGFDAGLAARVLAPRPAPPSRPVDGVTLLATSRLPVAATPLKLDYLGPWNYDNGLGVASRGMVQALWRTPFRINLRPVRKPFHTHARFAPMVDVIDFDEPADVAVIHLNPDGMRLLDDDQRTRIANASLRIGLWVWEMGAAPDAWRDALDDVDAVWAPSEYCAAVFRAAVPRKPVHVVPHVVETVPPIASARLRPRLQAAYGVPCDRRLIVYAFDGASYLVRKNPAALVRAFEASGLGAEGWTLVLKTKNLFDRPHQGDELAELARDTGHVVLIDAAVNKAELRAIVGAADIYASPHCAEGFGLTVAEAMGMGCSVVATDYSGTRDFLDGECGYPVRYARQRLNEDHGHYRRGGTWARIDETALAGALREAAADLDRGTGPGDRGRRRIAERFSAERVAGLIQASVTELVATRPL